MKHICFTDRKGGFILNEEKKKAVKAVLHGIEKEYGSGSIMMLGDNPNMDVKIFSSGSLQLDYALGGGIPRGRIVEIFGPESSGKTTLALHMIAEIQKDGGVAGFVDAEHALDPKYAKNIGVAIGELAISQPENGEQALSIVEKLVESGNFDIVVVDSVAALVPKAEIDGDMGDANVGMHARLMSKAMRKLTGVISKSNCTVVFINQLREKVGVMYGNPETTTGGRALKFYASVRLDVRKKETIKDGSEAVANHVVVKVVKNKIAPPFRTAEFDIVFGEGICKTKEVAAIAVALGIIEKKGGFYSYGDEKMHGMSAVQEYFKPDTEAFDELYAKVKAALYEKESTSGYSDLPETISPDEDVEDDDE